MKEKLQKTISLLEEFLLDEDKIRNEVVCEKIEKAIDLLRDAKKARKTTMKEFMDNDAGTVIERLEREYCSDFPPNLSPERAQVLVEGLRIIRREVWDRVKWL